jgi:hypothetical protein
LWVIVFGVVQGLVATTQEKMIFKIIKEESYGTESQYQKF